MSDKQKRILECIAWIIVVAIIAIASFGLARAAQNHFFQPETPVPTEPDTMGSNYTPLPIDGVRQWWRERMNFSPAEPPPGYAELIDCSRWQEHIDHPNTCGIGAFVRASAAGTTCIIYEDSYFQQNAVGFEAAGKPRDYYHFFRPQCDPVAQANFFADTIFPYPGDMIPVLDVEVDGGLSAVTVLARVRTFLTVFEERTGKKAMIYTSPGFWNGNVARSPWISEHPLWVAHWGVSEPYLPHDWDDWLFWQYDVISDGEQCGVSSRDLDHDVFHGTETDFHLRFPAEEPPPPASCNPELPPRVLLRFGELEQWYAQECDE